MKLPLLIGLLAVSVASVAAQHRLVVDLVPGPNSSRPVSLQAFDGSLYFIANSENEFDPSQYLYYLYRYTPGGEVERVSDVVVGRGGQPPSRTATLNGALYFSGEVPGTTDRELFRYRPASGVELVADLLEGENGYGSQVKSIGVAGGVLYFRAQNVLWRYTEADGPSVVSDEPLGLDNILYYSEDQDALYIVYRQRVWGLFRYTPTTGLQAIDTGGINYNFHDAFDYNGATYFPEYTVQSQQVQRLWRHDAEDGLTLAIEDDPNPTSEEGGQWRRVAEYDGDLYLAASDSDVSFGSHTLWRYTPAGDLEAVGFPDMEFRAGISYDGALYFSGFTDQVGHELWRYTPNGEPELAANIHQGASGAFPGGFVVLGDTLYFTALESQTGYELYAYSPAPKATSTDVLPEGAFALTVSPNPSAGPVEIRISGETEDHARVSVFDAVGREVAVVYDGPVGGEMRFGLGQVHLTSGVYVVRAVSTRSSRSRVFTVSK